MMWQYYKPKKSMRFLWESVVIFFEANGLDTSIFKPPVDYVDYGRVMNRAFAQMRNMNIDQDFYTFYKKRKRGKEHV